MNDLISKHRIHTSFVIHDDNKQRIDNILVKKFNSISRNIIQKYIKAGFLRINKHIITKVSIVPKMNDFIYFSCSKQQSSNNNYKVLPVNMNLDILYKDDDLLVINKKSGITVHPSLGYSGDTLIQGVFFLSPQVKHVGKPMKYGLVHRLDKGTSGVILVGLNNESLWYYERQFEERRVRKFYLAGISGNIKNLFQGRNSIQLYDYLYVNKKKKKVSVVEKEKGKLAACDVWFLDSKIYNSSPASLILVELKTGRTHQIRVQLSHLGYPVIGDNLYKGIKNKQILLHSYKLGVRLLNGMYQTFTASIPEEFGIFDLGKAILKIDRIINSRVK